MCYRHLSLDQAMHLHAYHEAYQAIIVSLRRFCCYLNYQTYHLPEKYTSISRVTTILGERIMQMKDSRRQYLCRFFYYFINNEKKSAIE